MSLNERSQREILHGRQLAALGDPELIWHWATPAGQVRAKRRAKLLAEAARLEPGMKVLEVGCGTGLFTEILAGYGAHILAVDISPGLLTLARRRQLTQFECREMRFDDAAIDEQFDAVVGSSVLHH